MTTKSQNQFTTKGDLKKLGTGISKDIRGFKNEIKNYMGVLHEQFSDQVKVVAEQYTAIDKRLMRVESKTDMLIETVADIKVDTEMFIEKLESKIDKSEHKKLEHRVTVLESRT